VRRFVPGNRRLRATDRPIRATTLACACQCGASVRSPLVIAERLEKNADHEPPRAHLETT
jgi:hypothetical protein